MYFKPQWIIASKIVNFAIMIRTKLAIPWGCIEIYMRTSVPTCWFKKFQIWFSTRTIFSSYCRPLNPHTLFNTFYSSCAIWTFSNKHSASDIGTCSIYLYSFGAKTVGPAIFTGLHASNGSIYIIWVTRECQYRENCTKLNYMDSAAV